MKHNTLPQKTMPQMLAQNAERIGDNTAIRQKEYGIWTATSWKTYFGRSCDIAHGLRAFGIRKGSHIAVLSENRIEWVLAQMGAGINGAVTVGVYPTSPVNEVRYVLEHSRAEIVICEDEEQLDKVVEILSDLPSLRHIVVIETKGIRAYPGDIVKTFEKLEAIGSAQRKSEPGHVESSLAVQDLDDVAMMIYTSGSTGKPKGAMLSWRNLRAEAFAIQEMLAISERDCHLSYLPLCHVAEQMFTTMGPIYLGSRVDFGESLRTVQQDLREVAPTTFLGVPRIWEKLHSSIQIGLIEAGGLRRKIHDRGVMACGKFANIPRNRRTFAQRLTLQFYYWLVFRALQNFIGLRKSRLAYTGAAPISPSIVHYFRTIGVPLVELYGATETTGIVLGQSLDHLIPGSVGEAAPNAEVTIGENGELLVRGETVFCGYYRDDQATRQAIRAGWLHTGDVVEQIDGQFRIIDRLKDIMITAGGKNLSPSEIENTIKASPYIKECVVVAERRNYVAALIQIDGEVVGKWAEEQKIPYTTYRSLVENPRVAALIDGEVRRHNASLANVAQVRKFHLLVKELDHDDDEVTATMKIRRANIQQKYSAQIEALYA
ncbi:AMP-binding protein (plasmid) [Agrobacterium leguminum]|uniref:AMP-dependent synthetase and ligase n=1 Tax=Agrobacterium deltaense NCPPB 1641 TaxID=1183425 RepID=A0A1S7U7C3_9HYPH|nr:MULTISPECIES: AMP-binding protein [Agrobacterium]WFS69816.1 AMP-binding protein [Agrobacterium leguminum]CVI62632.1 AMP-dependent synthetase and ligase [Agrobacterium deltaense NCPPB 1641]